MFKPEKRFVSPFYLFEQEFYPFVKNKISSMAPALTEKRFSSAESALANQVICPVFSINLYNWNLIEMFRI
jgi:hypothetical protein